MEVTEMTLWENVLAHYGWQGAALRGGRNTL